MELMAELLPAWLLQGNLTLIFRFVRANQL